MEKSANQRWKESGSTLKFKDWIDRENNKKQSEEHDVLPFDNSMTINEDAVVNADGVDTTKLIEDTIQSVNPLKTKADSNKILGLDRNILIFSTIIVVGSLGYYFYNRVKNSKK
jgi:hypothetical protein